MDDFSAIVARHLHEAERPTGTREDLFDRYMGEPYGDEVEGRSQVITSEVFDVVESVTAELMDLLASDEAIVSFNPEGPDDEEKAQGETEACNDIFWRRNNGFEILQTWAKAGLIEQVGYVRSGWVEEERVTIDEYSELSLPDALAVKARYESDPDIADVEIIDAEGFSEEDGTYTPEIDEETGEPEPISFKVRCLKTVSTYSIEPIPQSSVRMTPRWHKVDVQDVPFFAIEHTELTRSDLRAMGFHADDVEELSMDDGDEAEDNRHDTRDNEDIDTADSADDATTQVRVFECWVLADEDGDGIAERLKVWVGTNGKTILRWEDGTEAKEEVDSIEVSAWTPIIVPHRHVGRALSEVVDDLQRINTVLTRHTLDSFYATLYPRPVVNHMEASEHTYIDLANVEHGKPIRVQGPNAVTWNKPPTIAGETTAMMERMNTVKEERTGVTRLNQGMDSETLNKTAQGQAQLMTQAQKRLKLVARNLAEGVRDLFLRMHRDLRRGNLDVIHYQKGGQWMEQRPVHWGERRNMTVSVGAGNGDKDEKRQTLQMVANFQEKLATAGSLMVDESKMYETLDRMVRLGGYTGASPFFVDPQSPQYMQAAQAKQQEPQQPDPNMVLAQAEAEKARAQTGKYEAEAQLKLAQIELDAQKAQQDHERRMYELQLKERGIDIDEVKVAADIQNKGEEQDLKEAAQAADEAFRRDELATEIIRDDARASQSSRLQGDG